MSTESVTAGAGPLARGTVEVHPVTQLRVIRSEWTFGAVPRRLPVLWAKSIVYAVVALAVMLVATFIAFLGGQAALSSKQLNASLSDPGVARAVVGAALYLTVVGLFGIALGALIRSTAGGIATLFGLLLVLPLIVHSCPRAGAGTSASTCRATPDRRCSTSSATPPRSRHGRALRSCVATSWWRCWPQPCCYAAATPDSVQGSQQPA
jgi:hypothetical protein